MKEKKKNETHTSYIETFDGNIVFWHWVVYV